MKQASIENAYLNPRTGFISADKLKKKLTLREVKDVVDLQAPDQIHRQTKPSSIAYAPILAEVGTFQADLTFYEKYKRYNSNYIGMLCVVEVRTRMAFIYPIKTKSASEIKECFEEFLDDTNKLNKEVKRIETDDGGEFKGSVRTWFNDHKIEHTIFENKNSTGIVERFNQTLRNMIERYLTTQDKPRWIDVLEDLQHNYNTTYHRTIKAEPATVTPEQENVIANDIKSKSKALAANQEFDMGMHVRYLITDKHDNTFTKGRQQWSRETYPIVKIDKNRFYLEGMRRPFMHYQLQVVPDETNRVAKTVHPEVHREYKLQKQTRDINREGIFDNMKEARQAVDAQPAEVINITDEPDIRRSTRVRKPPQRLTF